MGFCLCFNRLNSKVAPQYVFQRTNLVWIVYACSYLKKKLCIYFTLLYWFLPYIDLNPPWVYMCSPSWTPFHLPHHPIPLSHPSAPAPSTLHHASSKAILREKHGTGGINLPDSSLYYACSFYRNLGISIGLGTTMSIMGSIPGIWKNLNN